MAYGVKHRPSKLEDVVGNKTEIASIRHLLNSNEIPKTWMIAGPSGTGKTTIARILAKHFGATTSSSLIEMNAADNRGIDDIRNLSNLVAFRQPGASATVVILDECHQLTEAAQNALLKILEEPPVHAYFILATTDPGKILGTVRTRCSHFYLEPVPEKEIKALLIKVAKEEGITPHDDVINEVVNFASGSPRQALNMLERAHACESAEDARKMLEKTKLAADIEGEKVISKKIINLVLDKKAAAWKEVGELLRLALFEHRVDPKELRTGIVYQLSFMLLKGDTRFAGWLEVMANRQSNYINSAELISDLHKGISTTGGSSSQPRSFSRGGSPKPTDPTSSSGFRQTGSGSGEIL